MDFRSHKMAQGGLTAPNNFRKIHSEKAQKSKYEHIVRTTAEIEEEERKMREQTQMEEDDAQDDWEDV